MRVNQHLPHSHTFTRIASLTKTTEKYNGFRDCPADHPNCVHSVNGETVALVINITKEKASTATNTPPKVNKFLHSHDYGRRIISEVKRNCATNYFFCPSYHSNCQGEVKLVYDASLSNLLTTQTGISEQVKVNKKSHRHTHEWKDATFDWWFGTLRKGGIDDFCDDNHTMCVIMGFFSDTADFLSGVNRIDGVTSTEAG